MDFYTNVIQRGNALLVRSVENGKRVRDRVNYQPTLFDLSPEPTGYVTLDGQHVKPNKRDSIKDAKDWLEQRQNQDIVFGNTQYPYCYISDQYPDDVPWDKDQLLIVTIDIEVECENGFPNPKDAAEGTIRKKYGISIDKNSVHGSDSLENAKIELDFFFKD